MLKQLFSQFLLSYLRFFAKLQLKKNAPIIIGVTGSFGKSSTRKAIYDILKDLYKVKTGFKANSESGIPLDILGLEMHTFSIFEWLSLVFKAPLQLILNWEKYDVYLVEMGIDSPNPPKNMSYLLTIVKPNIGVILNSGPVHAETFDHLVTAKDPKEREHQLIQLIAKEKGLIVTTLEKNDTAVVNFRQPEILSLTDQIQAKILGFGSHPNSTVDYQGYKVDLTGTSFIVRHNDKDYKVNIDDQALPSDFGETICASLCVALAMKIDIAKAIDLLEKNFKIPAGRSSLLKGLNGSYIIDSSYNSSPQPAKDALKLLNDIKGNKKYALLGDMRELGIVSQLEHELIAEKASQVCDEVFLVGPMMQKFAMPIFAKNKTPHKHFKNAYEAGNYIKDILKKDDLILIKASQNTLFLEIAVEILMQDKDKKESLLCRRGEFWDRKRKSIYF